MPKIDFYLLSETSMAARLDFACRLIEKAYKNRHRIYIHVESQSIAHELDERLWTFRDNSFLPHNLYGEGPEPAPPIQIGFDATPNQHRDILMNLHPTIPEFFTQFNRVLELVSSDTDVQTISREHYRFYRSKQYDITTHKLQNVEA